MSELENRGNLPGSGTDKLQIAAHVDPQAKQLEILNEIARIATLDLELRPMLQRITDALAEKFGWEFVACISIDRERGVFVCEALSTNRPTEIHPGYSRPLGSGVVGEVALNECSILLNDVRLSQNYVETMSGALSELCVPVKHGGKIVAVLNVESLRLGAFQDQQTLLETVAEQVAGAIASARLYEEVNRRARLMEIMSEISRNALEAGDLPALLRRLVDYMQQRFDLLYAAIVLVEEGATEYRQTAFSGTPLEVMEGSSLPIDKGIVGRCLRSGEPQLVLDVSADPDYVRVNDRVSSELVVPIRFREELLGAFNLESESPDVFSHENQVVFRTFADQVAGAVHFAAVNERLLETTRQLEEANLRLQKLSMLDGLTGIANRRHFDEVLDVEWRRAFRARSPISLILFDIDSFKAFNDAYGHPAGDECLSKVAGTLSDSLHRAGEIVARYGGEEFVVILPSTDLNHATLLAETLRQRIEALCIPHVYSTAAGVVTISAGVATANPAEGSTAAALITAADKALYLAKRQGRNRVKRAM